MARIHVFADEAGNFDFSRDRGASRYFILTTVTLPDCKVGDALLDLRRELAWSGVELPGHFHATEDKQAVRDLVYGVLAAHEFRVDATILEKAKTYPHLRVDAQRFHKTAWYLHMKRLAPAITSSNDELLVVASSLGTRKQRDYFVRALRDVVAQASSSAVYRSAFWPAGSDPCLEVADYCCWAIQRKWERNDDRSYALISDKIRIEADAFGRGTATYY